MYTQRFRIDRYFVKVEEGRGHPSSESPWRGRSRTSILWISAPWSFWCQTSGAAA